MAKINALSAPLTCSRFWQHQVEPHACHDHSQKRGKLELPRGFLHTHTMGTTATTMMGTVKSPFGDR